MAGIWYANPHRQMSIARGLRFYCDGQQCRAGHMSERYTSSGQCLQCCKDHYREKPRSTRRCSPEPWDCPIRRQAFMAGETRYFTGIPCRNGHIHERRVRDGKCMACRRDTKQRGYKQQLLREKTCGVCGSSFTGRANKYCSDRCGFSRQREQTKQARLRDKALLMAAKALLRGEMR